MATENGNHSLSPKRKGNPDEVETLSKACSAISSALLMLAAAVGAEFNEEKAAVYLAALSKYNPETVLTAIEKAAAMWTFQSIPPLGFIVERVKELHRRAEGGPDPAYDRFVAKQLAAPKAKLLRSVLDGREQKQKPVPRGDLIRMGVETPRPVNVAARVVELRRQAAMLGAADWRQDSAGMSAGLL